MKIYLEYKDDKSEKFWEIEVNGKNHAVRYGSIGTYGRETTKDFESQEKAQQEADKLIASKKKKGYAEVMLENPALEPETELEKKQRGMSAELWEKARRKLLKETLYAKKRNDGFEYISKKQISLLLKKISLIDFDNMQKEVIRDEKKKVKEIKYSIDDKPILCIKNMFANQDYPRIYFYWEKTSDWYNYCKEDETEKGLTKLFEQFGQFYIDNSKKITIEQKNWTAEFFKETESKYKEKKAKNDKISKIAENNIEIVVQNLMQQAGYAYAMEEKKTTVLLRIKTSEYRFVEFSLPHKTFIKRIKKVIPTVELIRQNFYSDNILDFVLDSKEKGLEWGKVVYKREYIKGCFHEIDSVHFLPEFWGKRCKNYCEKTLLEGEKAKKNRCDFLKEIAEWDFPNLRKEIREDKYNNVGGIIINYFMGDRYLFRIRDDSIEFGCFSDLHINFNDSGGIPSKNEMQRFLEGFADFYSENLPKLKEEIEDKKKECKLAVLAHKNLPIEVQEILNKTDYEYTILLHGTGYDNNTFLHGAVYVKMQSAGRRIFEAQIEYKDYQDKLALIFPTFKMAEETLKNAELPFKFLRTRDSDYKNIRWGKEKQ